MVNQLKSILNTYFNKQIDAAALVQHCAGMYQSALSSREDSYALENIAILPFIHEIAYSSANMTDLTDTLDEIHRILNRTQAYHYSTFVQLPERPELSVFFSDSMLCGNALPRLAKTLPDYVEQPKFLADLLVNSIRSLLNGIPLSDYEDCDFNTVTCPEICFDSHVKHRIFTLLSYLSGLAPFCVHITYSVSADTYYCIF